MQAPRVPDTPEELLETPGASEPSGTPEHARGEHTGDEHAAWHHMQRDVDPDCVRDPGSDLKASWDLEGAEEVLEQDERERD